MSNERNTNASWRWMGAAVLALLLPVASAPATAADPALPSPAGKERPVTLETVPGSPIKRVILGAKAAERIDLKTGAGTEQAIVPRQMLGGIVVHPSAAGVTAAAAAKGDSGSKGGTEPWIRVALSAPEWERLAKDKPARIFPLETRTRLAGDLAAMPSGRPPQDNAKSGMLTLFFVVPSATSGLVPGDRVRVELQLEGGIEKQKVVPYSAVYYDAKGDAWVYVNTAPLAFVRERVTVDRVAGDLALLSSGPPPGTPVATVGVSLLYGAEIFGK